MQQVRPTNHVKLENKAENAGEDGLKSRDMKFARCNVATSKLLYCKSPCHTFGLFKGPAITLQNTFHLLFFFFELYSIRGLLGLSK